MSMQTESEFDRSLGEIIVNKEEFEAMQEQNALLVAILDGQTRIEAKLDSIIEVFGGLEKMMDQLKSEGMSGLLKMMRGK